LRIFSDFWGIFTDVRIFENFRGLKRIFGDFWSFLVNGEYLGAIPEEKS
jgi:hypothetical protein